MYVFTRDLYLVTAGAIHHSQTAKPQHGHEHEHKCCCYGTVMHRAFLHSFSTAQHRTALHRRACSLVDRAQLAIIATHLELFSRPFVSMCHCCIWFNVSVAAVSRLSVCLSVSQCKLQYSLVILHTFTNLAVICYT